MSYIPLEEVRAERLAKEKAAKLAAAKEARRAASGARVRANRRNAKKSTGPRSDAGKARSSRNAVTHGLFCRDVVLPGESKREFLALRLSFHCDLKAADSVEFAIVERAVIAQWHLVRARGAEADLHAAAAQRPLHRIKRKLAKLREELGDPRYDCTDELRAATAKRLRQIARWESKRDALRQGMPASCSLALDFAHPWCGSIERLARHAQRLEHHFDKALRALRTHRKAQRDAGIKRDEDVLYADVGAMRRELEACAEEEERVRARDVEGMEEEVEDVVAEATTPRGTVEVEEEERPNDDGDGDVHDEPARDDRSGVVTSVTTSSTSNAQNEPNADETRAGDDASEGCEQGSRTIEPVVPIKLAPRGADGACDDESEARDRT